jgi:hypothetical protein
MAQSAAVFSQSYFDQRESETISFRKERRVTINHLESSWTQALTDRMNILVKLRDNWDGYGASAVKVDTAMFAIQVLEQLCQDGVSAPSLVPSSCGGIQAEWHKGDSHIELLFSAPLKAHGWADVIGSVIDEEAEFDADYSLMSDWLTAFANVD